MKGIAGSTNATDVAAPRFSAGLRKFKKRGSPCRAVGNVAVVLGNTVHPSTIRLMFHGISHYLKRGEVAPTNLHIPIFGDCIHNIWYVSS
jgi:hypothetical protein